MIALRIAHLSRQAGRNQPWYHLDDTTETFPSLRDARRWCHDHLSRRWVPSLRDTEGGTAERCGRVYATRERHAGRTYYRQYWVEAYEVVRVPLV